jgi:hypothetical protein
LTRPGESAISRAGQAHSSIDGAGVIAMPIRAAANEVARLRVWTRMGSSDPWQHNTSLSALTPARSLQFVSSSRFMTVDEQGQFRIT